MNNRKRPGRARGADARLLASSDFQLFEEALRGRAESSIRKFDASTDRKTLQLCRQVQHALMLALAGECGDDLLCDIWVESVEPTGGGGHLLVKVVIPQDISVSLVLQRLEGRRGPLRSAIAASISRKRVPTLSFLPICSAAGGTP